MDERQLVNTSVILEDERSGVLGVPVEDFGDGLLLSMRTIVVDWLMQVSRVMKSKISTLLGGITILDAALVRMPNLARDELMLVAISSLALSSSHVEFYSMELADCVFVANGSQTREQIDDMYVRIFKLLGCSTSIPNDTDFLRIVSIHTDIDTERHNASRYLLLVCKLDTQVQRFLPSVRATACLYLTSLVLDGPDYVNVFNIPKEVVLTCAKKIIVLVRKNLKSGPKAHRNVPRPGELFAEVTPEDFIKSVSTLIVNITECFDTIEDYLTNTYIKRNLAIPLLPPEVVPSKARYLGRGSFGVVRAVEYKGVTYAVKTNKMDLDFKISQSFLREISIMLSMSNSNIVPIHHITSDLQSIFLEMGEGDLKKWIKKHGPMSADAQTGVAYQLLYALVYVHNCGALHRDIKPQNIIVYTDEEGTPTYKLSDFGSARGCDIATNTGNYTAELCTLWYKSPELLLGSLNYGDRLDVWSIMCVLYECANGKLLFPGKDENDQASHIFAILGTPTNETWPGVEDLPYYSLRAQKLYRKKHNIFTNNTKLSELTKSLLNEGLVLDPDQRPNSQTMYDLVTRHLS